MEEIYEWLSGGDLGMVYGTVAIGLSCIGGIANAISFSFFRR